MYSRAEILQIQRDITSAAPKALVLFGGSYWNGHPTEDSDVDFYCVAPIWLLLRYKSKLQAIVNSSNLKIQLILLPKFYYTHGWYWASGIGVNGSEHRSKERVDLSWRNSLKLALYYYLRWAVLQQPYWLQKARIQAAWARKLLAIPMPAAISDFKSELTSLLCEVSSKISWSWANYFIYNVHFLRQGSGLFLFKNPDKLVLHLLAQAVQNPSKKTLEDAGKIVLPIIALHNKKYEGNCL